MSGPSFVPIMDVVPGDVLSTGVVASIRDTPARRYFTLTDGFVHGEANTIRVLVRGHVEQADR